MSRIDEALKRLAGGVSPEQRTASMLDRYASEENPAVEEPRKQARIEEHKVAKFVVPAHRPVEERPVAVKVPTPPPAARPETTQQAEPSDDDGPLLETQVLINYVGFVGRSVRRHKWLAAATLTVVVAMTVAALMFLPRRYYVQTILLAQRNAVMTALSNPGRAVPWDADAPTRAAAETILRRDNLIALIEKTDLLREWERTRAPILKFKDRLTQAITRYTPTSEEKLDGLISKLEASMRVQAGPVGDGTVTIDLIWPDAEMASQLVQEAQEAFVAARQVAETAAIGESITILERYSASLKDGINRRVSELQRTHDRAATVVRRRTPLAPHAAETPSLENILEPPRVEDPLDDLDTNRLKATLARKLQDLSRIEHERHQQLTEVQAQLGQLKMVYTDNHPSVLSAQQKLVALSQETPQAVAIAAEIEELQAEYDKQRSDAIDRRIKEELDGRSAGVQTRAQAPAAQETIEPEPPPADSPLKEYATVGLRSELRQLESVLDRTDAARIELAVSRAAFKYRYTVIRPAQVPKDPVFPNFELVLAVGLFASLILAPVVVSAKDLLSNRVLEAWQVERQFGLPVLGTLRRG